jgi:hypothetical protein
VDFTQLSRIILTVAGIALVTFYPVKGSDPRRIRLFTWFLIACAVLSFYFHVELGPQYRNVSATQIMNPHDFYHYYIGSKYHEELGYFDLYECTVIADWDTLRNRGHDWVTRDLRTYRYRAVKEIAGSPQHCRSLFSEERWASFKSDVSVFSRSMSDSAWKRVLLDKGYNATPVWNLFATNLTNRIRLSSTAGLYFLLSLDYFYMLALFALVGWAFGWRNSLFVILFWGVNVMASTAFVKGSLSRLDWMFFLVGALCMLKRGRYAGGGVLAGLATSLRVFPVLFFFGLLFKCIWSVVRTRSIPRRYLRFGLAVLLTAAVLLGLTALTPEGRSDWRDFSFKISVHDDQIAGYRVGFKYAVIDSSPDSWVEKARQFERRKPFYWSGVALAFVLVFLASRRLDDDRTLGLSFVCAFFLTAPTFYYYLDLVVPFAMFLPDRRRPGLMFGMSVFFGWCLVGYLLRMMWPMGVALTHWLSWSLVALCAFILGQTFLTFRGDASAEETRDAA